jgi:hypothetical protein
VFPFHPLVRDLVLSRRQRSSATACREWRPASTCVLCASPPPATKSPGSHGKGVRTTVGAGLPTRPSSPNRHGSHVTFPRSK